MRKLLLAIDASASSLAAAHAAAFLASRLGASLEGLYVEDINLSRLALHPDVILIGANRHHPGPQQLIASALRLQEAAARKGFEDACRRTRLSGAFHVRQGRVEDELRAAAAAFDLLVMGWESRIPGSVGRQLMDDGLRPLLLVRADAAPTLRLAILKGDEAARALALRLGEGQPLMLDRLQDASPDLLLITSGPAPLSQPPCSLLLG